MITAKNIGALMLVLTIASEAMAQVTAPVPGRKQKRNIQAVMRATFKSISLDSIRWAVSDTELLVGSFRERDRQFDVTFDKKGNWVQTAERLSVDDLPDPFRLSLMENYDIEHFSDISPGVGSGCSP